MSLETLKVVIQVRQHSYVSCTVLNISSCGRLSSCTACCKRANRTLGQHPSPQSLIVEAAESLKVMHVLNNTKAAALVFVLFSLSLSLSLPRYSCFTVDLVFTEVQRQVRVRPGLLFITTLPLLDPGVAQAQNDPLTPQGLVALLDGSWGIFRCMWNP